MPSAYIRRDSGMHKLKSHRLTTVEQMIDQICRTSQLLFQIISGQNPRINLHRRLLQGGEFFDFEGIVACRELPVNHFKWFTALIIADVTDIPLCSFERGFCYACGKCRILCSIATTGNRAGEYTDVVIENQNAVTDKEIYRKCGADLQLHR